MWQQCPQCKGSGLEPISGIFAVGIILCIILELKFR